VLGLLCSNRFLSTQGGAALRQFLRREYDLRAIWDLGDTKLFSAAVLPAILIGIREASASECRFIRIYEDRETQDRAEPVASVISALEGGRKGLVEAGNGPFRIERGTLDADDSARGWRLTSGSHATWLATVRRNSVGQLGDLGAIRVGIKTTADRVFIRQSWADLPAKQQPEPELLHPLITHRIADRWSARAAENGDQRVVLYPHESFNSRRQPVDLGEFPRARTYLEGHRAQLEGRTYVRKAGRRWYEIWVPQQPSAWRAPKVVWPDISDQPRFFLDETGAIVNGDCYWITVDGLAEAQTALLLAVANSTFAVRFYDYSFGNRLYAGRRRFITQYVQRLPIPSIDRVDTEEVQAVVQALREAPQKSQDLEARLNGVIWEAFGLREEALR
jgi:hypothetical protein